MNKPYSDEMLKLDFIEDELANVRPDEDEKYQHKLDELLDKQDGYHKYETVTELKIDSNTTPPELIRFGELLETMSGPLKISVDYRQLKVERERSIKDRIADVCTSERYRRQEVNRQWENDRQADRGAELFDKQATTP